MITKIKESQMCAGNKVMSAVAFRANREDITGQPAAAGLDIERIQAVRADLEQYAEMNARIKIDNLDKDLGLVSGSVTGVSGRIASTVANTAQQKAEAERKAQQKADNNAFYIALMNDGGLDTYIAENIFSAMSADEIDALVADIEAETGQPLKTMHARSLALTLLRNAPVRAITTSAPAS